jgi:prepilin-type N-terminal cleavage/methylation domain-containing protein
VGKLINQFETGFSLIELMISIGVLSIVALVIAGTNAQLLKQSAVSGGPPQLDIFRRSFGGLILDEQSWLKTLQQNSAGGTYSAGKMDCLNGGLPCTQDGTANGPPIANQPFALLDRLGNLYYDATVAANGLTFDYSQCPAGSPAPPCPCSAFPSASCPYQYQLTWTAACNAGNCVNPLVAVNVILKTGSTPANGATYSLNPANYSLPTIYRSGQ